MAFRPQAIIYCRFKADLKSRVFLKAGDSRQKRLFKKELFNSKLL